MKVLWVPHASWSTPQRARLLSEALAARHEVHVTDWVANFHHPREVLTRTYWSNHLPRTWVEDGVTVHHVPRITPALYSKTLRAINRWIYAHYVRRIVEKSGVECVLGTYVVPPPKATRLIFDCFDNNPAYWREVIPHSDYAEEVEQIETQYAREADAVLTVSHVLRDKMLSLVPVDRAQNVQVLPNPVDLRRYQMADGDATRRRYGIEKKQVIGVGGLYTPFSGLLRFVEAANLLRGDPQYVFLVVGFGELLEPAKRRVQQLGLRNFIFTGRVPAADIPSYYKAMDVPVLPFDLNGFTHAACLIKVLDFSAANKRFVATDLEEIRRMGFPNVVLVRDTPEALVEGIKEALANPWTGTNHFLVEYDLPNVVRRLEAILCN